MKFKKEVQERFEKAGWHPNRNVSEVFDKIDRFDEFPQFLKEFLNEYGNLLVETDTLYAKGKLNLKALTSGYFKIDNYLNKPRYYGNIMTFPIGYYHLDTASLECDAEGRIYMVSDFPTLMSEDFKEGIEKVIMEDYSNTKEWDDEKQKWVD